MALLQAMMPTRRGTFYQASSTEPRPELAAPAGFRFGPIRLEGRSEPLLFERGRGSRFASRVRAGHRCMGFLAPSGEVASYLWITHHPGRASTAPWGLPGLAARWPAGTGYVWDCRTSPAYQGQGLYKAGLVRARALLAAEGAARACIDAVEGNAASVAGIRSAGFHPWFSYRTARLGPLWSVRVDGRRSIPVRDGVADLPPEGA